jgi:diguanylate cyclase (GGDEF)-like protein
MPPIPAALRPAYDTEQQVSRRHYNEMALISFATLFDLFLLAQLRSAPELVALSALLRLGVMTPCYAAFIWLDRRRGLGRLYDPLILVLALLPIVISALLCMRTTSATTLSDIRATPIILLCTGMIWRVAPRVAIANAVISSTILIAEVVAAGPQIVPPAELGSMILTDVVIAATVIGFVLQIERRDRLVFLLNTNERKRREGLAALNRGLLLQTQTDALTGVANRRCFDETLAATWMDSFKGGRGLSLIMIDVDHFKNYNDHYGHRRGDECLRVVAAAGRSVLRAGDLFARYGGEEFAVILPDAPIEVAASIAETIRLQVRALQLPHEGLGPDSKVSISLGVAWTLPKDPGGSEALMEAADREMYAAKTGGRNRVEQRVLFRE